MILILDFDRTIFHTDAFENEYSDAVAVKKSLWKDGDLARHIYDDTIPFLEAHTHLTRVLMTYGNKEFQRAKVSGSSISPHFEHEVYTGRELKGETIKRLYGENGHAEPIVFVDDTPYQLESVVAECPEVTAVRIKRIGETKSLEPSCKGCLEVEDLKELEALLKKI